MDNGPFRAPRSGDGNVDNQEEARSAEPSVKEPKPVIHRPSASHHNTMKMNQEKSKKPLIIAIVAAIVVVLVGIGGWVALSSGGVSGSTGIDSSKYQAVFFTNGQVYFGKLQSFNDEYMKLKEVYYLQTQASEDTDSKNPQQTSTDQNNTTLIKLGDEIHGPQDEMIISKEQVLFYENLKPEGKVASTIEQHKSTDKK